MSVETITRPGGGAVTAFPKAEVEAKLKGALLESARADAEMKGITLPSDIPGQASASVRLDSLDVVSLLCDVEPIVGFKLKDSLVRAGGYSSVNRAMDQLMPRIEEAWEKNKSKGAKK